MDNTAERPSSLGEQILVERSQDSVQVTKNRMQRQSMTSQDGGDEESSKGTGEQPKKAKTRFAPEAEELQHIDQKGRKSISKRISEALGFKKLNIAGGGKAVEHSPPSLHVKFDQKPEVID